MTPSTSWFAVREYQPALHVLLSEVVVSAEVAEVTYGFYSDGGPAALLALDNVVPLHVNVPIPEYTLVPIGQLVVGDRVICGSDMEPLYDWHPKAGDQIVLISRWRDQAVTLGSLGLAVVHDDKVLDWKFGLKGPDSLSVRFAYTMACRSFLPFQRRRPRSGSAM